MEFVGILGIIAAIAVPFVIQWWNSRDKPKASLRPKFPNFGPEDVNISFELVNEGKRAIEILMAEAKFDYKDVGDQTFTTDGTGFTFGGLVEPGMKVDKRARIRFISIGEEWRKLRQSHNVPSGMMRLKLRSGKKTGYTQWTRTMTGDERDRAS